MEGDLPLFKLEDLKNNKSKSSTWIIIHGIVYDVTKFLHEHPGGSEILLNHASQDATKDFEDIGHSEEARTKMKEFVIARIEVLNEVEDNNASNTSGRGKCHCEIM